MTQLPSKLPDGSEFPNDAVSGGHVVHRTFKTYERQRGKRTWVYGMTYGAMKVPPDTLAAYLDGLRQRADLSVRQLATEAGYKTGSGVQKFLEDPSYDKLQPKVAGKFARALYGKGAPPITLDDRLFGFEC